MKLHEIDNQYYMEEGCGIFVIALSIAKPGGEIYILSDRDGEKWSKNIPYEVTHAFYRLGTETWDVKGLRSIDNMAQEFRLNVEDYKVLGPWVPSEFRKKFIGTSDRYPLFGDNNDIKTALAKINSNPDLYNIKDSQ